MDSTFNNLYESVNKFSEASVAYRSAFSNITDYNTAIVSQLASKDAQIQQLNDRLTIMSMGRHFYHQPPSTPQRQSISRQRNTSISVNTNRVAESHVYMLEEDVEEGATDTVAMEVLGAVDNVDRKSHPPA